MKLLNDAPMWFKPFVIPALVIANILGFSVGAIIVYLTIFIMITGV
jgi:hypothetical protein